jgi:hypothetical protein
MTSEAALDTYLDLLRPIEQEIKRAVRCSDSTVSRKLIAEHASALKTRLEFDREAIASENQSDSAEASARRKRRMLALFDPASVETPSGMSSSVIDLDDDITTMRPDAFLKLLNKRDEEIARLQCRLVQLTERNDVLVKEIDTLTRSEYETSDDDDDDESNHSLLLSGTTT